MKDTVFFSPGTAEWGGALGFFKSHSWLMNLDVLGCQPHLLLYSNAVVLSSSGHQKRIFPYRPCARLKLQVQPSYTPSTNNDHNIMKGWIYLLPVFLRLSTYSSGNQNITINQQRLILRKN